MNPRLCIAFENTNIYIRGITLYESGIVAEAGPAVDTDGTKFKIR